MWSPEGRNDLHPDLPDDINPFKKQGPGGPGDPFGGGMGPGGGNMFI